MKVIVLTAFLLFGCGSHTWSQSTENSFMAGCAIRASLVKPCLCAMEQLKDRYSEEEIIRLNNDYLAGKGFPNSVYEIVAACQ